MKRSLSSKLLMIGLAPVLAACVYAALVFYSRSRENQHLEEMERAKQAERDRKFLSIYGSDRVRFSHFYARSGKIRAGSTDLVCYGVINAKSVRMDPPVEAVHPAANYCFNVAPAKTTTYTLSAEGKAGGTATESLSITVE
jgi:hypothetical protein